MTATRPSGAPYGPEGTGTGSEAGPDSDKPPQGRTAPRRLRIAVDNDHAEAVEFSIGIIVAFWWEAKHLYAWRSLADLREQLPGAKLTWLDEDHIAALDRPEGT